MSSQEFTEDEMLAAHDEGKHSFRSGSSADQCPYSDSRAERWKQGFREAEASFLSAAQARPQTNAEATQRGLVGRLWRGEEGLGRTYWLYGVLYSLIASFFVQVLLLNVAEIPEAQAFMIPKAQAVVAFAWLAYFIFISVAIWRSAIATGPITGWGMLARFQVLGVPLIGLLAAIALPMWQDSTQAMAPTAEPYSYSAPAVEPVTSADDDVLRAAEYAMARFPFLDSESPSANNAAIDETIELRDQFIADGYSAGTAIRMAAEITGAKYAR